MAFQPGGQASRQGWGGGAGPHVDSEYSSVLGGQLYSLQTSNGSVLQPETF